jgi:predicted nucleic-acid-binding protein
MKLLDTNVLLRWLLRDDKPQAEAVDKFLRAAFRIKDSLFVADLALAEIVWVLEGNETPLAQIARIIRSILNKPEIQCENRERLLAAITLYEAHQVDFIDACQAALVQEKRMDAVVSFDRDFAKLPVVHLNPTVSFNP